MRVWLQVGAAIVAPACVESGVSEIDAGSDTAEPGRPGCASGSVILGSLSSVYCLDLVTLDTVRIPVDSPNSWNIVSGLALDETGELFSACFGHLYEVELEKGLLRWVADTLATGCSLAALRDGLFVGVGGAQFDELYVIDPEDGGASQVATISGFQGDGDLVLHPDGFVYWAVCEDEELCKSHLLRVDPVTWAVSYVGAIDVDFTLGLAYADGRLIGAGGGEPGVPTGEVFEIDPETAETTEITQIDDWVFDATAAPWW